MNDAEKSDKSAGEKRSMRSQTGTLFETTLGAALFLAAGAMAADLPKKGNFTVPFYAFGTWKGVPMVHGRVCRSGKRASLARMRKTG